MPQSTLDGPIDLDADDDGVLDTIPYGSELDCISTGLDSNNDNFYCQDKV